MLKRYLMVGIWVGLGWVVHDINEPGPQHMEIIMLVCPKSYHNYSLALLLAVPNSHPF